MKMRWLWLPVLLAAECANLSAQEPPIIVKMSAESVFTYGQLARYDGVTFCSGRNVVSYVKMGLDSINRIDVQAHEAKHREQYTRWSSCQAFDAYYRTPVGRLESEAEAYAVGWCAAKRAGHDDPDDLRRLYIQNLYRILGGGTPIMSVVQAWKRYENCP